eukprot:TRINITY_DN1171_c0_g1_i1.p1 TRINITY_DN1171_c0_g1~~TRINITY_DN1171_c0_g1_i1.p1  ORF type:complete len:256 (+),score=55.13 TRINITY_DN1171_c0_g1_i1:52-819(+)
MTRPEWCAGVVEPVVLEDTPEEGQVFPDSADVDRMKLPYTLIKLGEGGGSAEAEVVKMPKVDGAPERFAVYVRELLSGEECDAILAKCNEKKFGRSLINIGRGRQAYYPDTRSGFRCIVDDSEFAASLMKRLETFLPRTWDGRILYDINERLRILCYEKASDCFEAHFDGCYTRPFGHPREGDKSKITIQIYLNTVPPGKGGETTLFLSEDQATKIHPEKGAVLLFSQNIYHEGTALKCNGLKYALRTEAMYSMA